MPERLEIMLKPEIRDPEGETLRRKAREYLGIKLEEVRTIQVLILDTSLRREQLEAVRQEIFTNPVTQISSFEPLARDFDWIIWVGFLPGVRDNAGSTAVEAIEAFLDLTLPAGEGVYTSKQYGIKARRLKREGVERIARELLANDLIQQWRVIHRSEWDPRVGIGTPHPQGPPGPSADRLPHPRRFPGGIGLVEPGTVLGLAQGGYGRHPRLLLEAGGLGGAKGRGAILAYRCGTGIHLPSPQRPLQP
jgi:phosphoribosylformylglycinamidine (FGAM) synthase PurS component